MCVVLSIHNKWILDEKKRKYNGDDDWRKNVFFSLSVFLLFGGFDSLE